MEIQDHLNMDIDTAGDFGMFDLSPDATYIRYVKDTNSSFSLNYYSIKARNDSVRILGNKQGAFNKMGYD